MIRISLAVAVTILFFCPLAQATTLEITSGSISSNPILRDTFYGFGGPGFSASGMLLSTHYTGGPTFSIGFINTTAIIPTQINISGFAPCIPVDLLSSCGVINLFIDPLPPVVDPATYLATVHFVGTGHANTQPIPIFGLPTECCDIAGHGLLTMRYVPDAFGGFQPQPTFVFVPEASSLLMLGVGLLALLGISRKLKAKPLHA